MGALATMVVFFSLPGCSYSVCEDFVVQWWIDPLWGQLVGGRRGDWCLWIRGVDIFQRFCADHALACPLGCWGGWACLAVGDIKKNVRHVRVFHPYSHLLSFLILHDHYPVPFPRGEAGHPLMAGCDYICPEDMVQGQPGGVCPYSRDVCWRLSVVVSHPDALWCCLGGCADFPCFG